MHVMCIQHIYIYAACSTLAPCNLHYPLPKFNFQPAPCICLLHIFFYCRGLQECNRGCWCVAATAINISQLDTIREKPMRVGLHCSVSFSFLRRWRIKHNKHSTISLGLLVQSCPINLNLTRSSLRELHIFPTVMYS